MMLFYVTVVLWIVAFEVQFTCRQLESINGELTAGAFVLVVTFGLFVMSFIGGDLLSPILMAITFIVEGVYVFCTAVAMFRMRG